MTVDIPALREAAEKATPGPWHHRQAGVINTYGKALDWLADTPTGQSHKRIVIGRNCLHGGSPDYAFIASANPQVILEPLSSIEADKGEIERLREALAPFAAYMSQMDAYAMLHRGKDLPDNKVLAYSQTEMNTAAGLYVGHFRDAQAVMEGHTLPAWGGVYRSKVRALTPAGQQ